ncbi:EamA family transporter [Pyramidobacter sp. YE332]|uniref:DMT family transporter n=1 Tax=Pyramidobacter sp. YE332 TaxID=3068894 RepID=UPI00294ACE6E|nr:EamA family transporter [Pyramidobacter sp. YE332]WOL39673.1 EamA family transporter [Pyramidobacter sp. YE332]
MSSASRSLGVFAMLMAGLFWGGSGTISRFAPAAALNQPLALAWTRLFFGGVMLCAAALAVRRRGVFSTARAAFLAGICTAMNQTGFFISMDVLGVALGTMLVIGSSLVMAGVLGCFLGEAPSRLWWFAALLGVAGSCLAAAPGSSGASFQVAGLLWGLLGGLGYALLGLNLKLLARRGLGPLESNGAALLWGAVLMLPLLWGRDMSWLATGRGMASALALGFFPTAVPYFFFALALARITVGQSYTIGLVEPLTAGLLGLFFLGETATAVQAAGMALEFACMALTGWDALHKS